MKIVVLDFSDGKVKIINNIPKKIENDDYELFLYKEYNLKSSYIEYMIVPDIEIKSL